MSGKRFNLAQYLLDARLEEGREDDVAILEPARSVTYGEVAREAAAVTERLQDIGVRPGDRVLIAMPDGADFVAAFFATLKIGAVAAMANPDIPADERAYLVSYTEARAIITPAGVAATVDKAMRGPATSSANPGTRAEDPALWLFTSGSTGKPKAAIHNHRDFAFHIEAYAKQVLGLRASDITLAAPKLYFPYATGMSLMFPFAVGARTILFPEHPTPARLFELIDRFKPTIFTTVPTMTAKMLDAAGAGARDLSCLRLAVTAGEALPPDLHRRWNETFGVEMLDGLGSAEMFHIYLSNRPGDVKPGSLGRAVPGYRTRVVRPDGTDASDGEVGTLWVSGGSAFTGYHGDPEHTREVLRDGWVISGDMFRRDAGGHHYYEGRADDMLKVAGIYVSPVEVENVLRAHPGVAECAVVGYEDTAGLTKPRAFVVPSAGRIANDAFFADLTTWTRDRLAHYKVPRSWVAREALPRNDRGKILRRALRGPGGRTSDL